MSMFIEGEIGRRMSNAELAGLEKDLRAMQMPDEDKAPFLNLLFWATAGLNADELMAVYDRDKDAMKAEIESLKASYIKACELAEQNRAKLHALESQLKQATKTIEKGRVLVSRIVDHLGARLIECDSCEKAVKEFYTALSDNAELKGEM